MLSVWWPPACPRTLHTGLRGGGRLGIDHPPSPPPGEAGGGGGGGGVTYVGGAKGDV